MMAVKLGWLLYKGDCNIRVSRSHILHVVDIRTISRWFEMDSSKPLEYASMLSNPTRHQF